MDRLSRLQGISGELDNQFAVASSGVTVLIDGDIIAYNVTANVAKLSTAIRRFQQEVLKAIFLTGAQRAIVHLTSSSGDKNKRKLIVADLPYQSNRAGKAKPPLLEALRVSMSKESNWLDMFKCYLWEDSIIDGMPIGAIQVGELLSYESKRSISGSFSYSAPENQHDDTVMALAIAWNGMTAGNVVYAPYLFG